MSYIYQYGIEFVGHTLILVKTMGIEYSQNNFSIKDLVSFLYSDFSYLLYLSLMKKGRHSGWFQSDSLEAILTFKESLH